jgi:hypothetical protein
MKKNRLVHFLVLSFLLVSISIIEMPKIYADDPPPDTEWHECKASDGCYTWGCYLEKPDGYYTDCHLYNCYGGIIKDCRKHEN